LSSSSSRSPRPRSAAAPRTSDRLLDAFLIPVGAHRGLQEAQHREGRCGRRHSGHGLAAGRSGTTSPERRGTRGRRRKGGTGGRGTT
jgi:hypothetical protein